MKAFHRMFGLVRRESPPVRRRSPDPADRPSEGLHDAEETCGRAGGSVSRLNHNVESSHNVGPSHNRGGRPSHSGGGRRGRKCACTQRRGITLFEVLLALVIFVGALAAIGQIVDTGTTASARGELQSEAVLRCETKLAEVIAGIEPMSSVQGAGFEDSPDWNWSLAVADGPHPDLLQLTVAVSHARSNGATDAEFVLTRLVRDPQLFIDAAAAAQEVE